MSRKREKPYFSRHIPYSYPKRRRPPPPPVEDLPQDKPAPPPAIAVIGLPLHCSVLDLKARFEIYGSISRIRVDKDGVGFISFRTKSSAEDAIAASLDPSFGISVDSNQVQVMWGSEVKEGGGDEDEEMRHRVSSKLLKGEAPLRRHGRGNRLSSAIVNPNATTTTDSSNRNSNSNSPPFNPRQIIAYDDIL